MMSESYLSLALIPMTVVFIIGFLYLKSREKKIIDAAAFIIEGGPYRIPAIRNEEPEIKKQINTKREVKMGFKLGKFTKLFLQLVPICMIVIGMGLLYDHPTMGLGFKWGLGAALGIIGVFFGGLFTTTLEKKE